MSPPPSLRTERALLRDGARLVAGMDEVGRGALGGPVSVGVVVVDTESRTAPTGLRDSKLLSPAVREALVPRLRRWARAWAVGHASAEEIDAIGILGALRLAGERALDQLPVRPCRVLLDGNHDWLTRRAEQPALPLPGLVARSVDRMGRPERVPTPPVSLLVQADRTCSSVAAASVLAKTTRDALMRDLAARYPAYGWDVNKGYAAPDHLAALRVCGPSDQHRRTWRIQVLAASGQEVAG